MKTAVVTGGASGIGKAVAERLRADGYHVATIDLNPSGEEFAQTAFILRDWALIESSTALLLARDANDANKPQCTHPQMLTYRPKRPYRRFGLPGCGPANAAPIKMR